MKKRLRGLLIHIMQIFVVSVITVSADYLMIMMTNDDSIWLGESIEAVASIIFGPVVGGVSTFFNCLLTDYLTYQSLDYGFVAINEAASMIIIGVIYRRLIKDQDKFGVREIVVFNFLQVLVNTAVIFLSTPASAVLFFGHIVNKWTRDVLVEEMAALGNDTFSACVSVALIGTVLLAVCIAIRKKIREHGGVRAAFHSILKPTYINKEYRIRALEYTVGMFFAIGLMMVDGVVSGRVLGTDALAATSIMIPLVSLSTFLSNIITTGCSNLCAIARGDGDYDRANKLFSQGLLATILIGVMQSALFFIIRDYYFGYFSTSPEIEAFAREYYNIYILVPPFLALSKFFDEMASSDGDDGLSYAGYLTSFAVNVGMSIVLARMIGMGGLSLATMISYIGYIIVVSIHFLKKSNTYRLRWHFSFRDLCDFAVRSLKANTSGLCMSVVSTAFTKTILLMWGSGYLIANTVLCAMLEIYEMINGPSEAAEYLSATYYGEKNGEGLKILFREVLMACLFCGIILMYILLLKPGVVLELYGIEESPLSGELIRCIRFSSVGLIAAAVGGFLSDFYGNTGKPLWSCMMVIFRTALFPILFCVTFCLDGGAVGMGKGMLLAQITAVAVFYGFVLIVKGSESIPYMFDDPEFEKVHMNSFDYTPQEYERIAGWINEQLTDQGIEYREIEKTKELFLSLCRETQDKGGKNKVLGECVIRFIDEPEITVKNNAPLFKPEIEDERLSYNILMSCNSSKIRVKSCMNKHNPQKLSGI